MSKVIKIKRGLNIKLVGKADKIFVKAERAETYAVKPVDFHGLTPKLAVKPDDEVKAGSVLFYDKYHPEVKFTSPVSGKVLVINRGERRRILEVVVQADGMDKYEEFKKGDPSTMSAEEVKQNILASGLWPSFKQRPYDIVANPDNTPRDIFISAFDTAPLAPDVDFLVKGFENEFQTGINALLKLTTGKVHININNEFPASRVFSQAKGVQINAFEGPHPAGNVGVQIHHIAPVNKGEVVWSIDPQHVIMLGRLFNTGTYEASKVIALTGSEVLKPRYYKIISGTAIKPLISNNVSDKQNRYISGDPLTGSKILPTGFMGYYDDQLSVIPEGFEHEFLGWAAPGFGKFSASRTFWSWMTPSKEYALNTNMHGGERAFVITGAYEQVLPMDILPMQLLKAILVEDIDLMEKLGIYELAPEDMALCEFVCPSKIEIQSLVRKGLDIMVKEVG